jgi:hypothetical protein
MMKQFLFEAEPDQITSFSDTANWSPRKLHQILMAYVLAFRLTGTKKVCTTRSNNSTGLLEPSLLSLVLLE